MSLSRRAVIASTLATAAIGVGRGKAASNESPATILQLQRRNIEVNGKSASVYGIRQPNGTAGIATSVGDTFRVRVENQIDVPSLIHWHGMAPRDTSFRRLNRRHLFDIQPTPASPSGLALTIAPYCRLAELL